MDPPYLKVKRQFASGWAQNIQHSVHFFGNVCIGDV